MRRDPTIPLRDCDDDRGIHHPAHVYIAVDKERSFLAQCAGNEELEPFVVVQPMETASVDAVQQTLSEASLDSVTETIFDEIQTMLVNNETFMPHREDGTGSAADLHRGTLWASLSVTDSMTWRDFLGRAVCMAVQEKDPDKLRAALVRVAAIAVAWSGDLDLNL